MKRNENIVALSRDHHYGLLFCWKIRQGLKKQVPASRIQPYVRYFWTQHLQQHFGEEESLLFSAAQDELCRQAEAEHREIRELILTISHMEALTPDNLHLLADLVDKHIRFEERVLFPHLEKILPEEMLASIGQRLTELHQTELKDQYPDEFWV
jgi:hemerythrin-like domain-containing protein